MSKIYSNVYHVHSTPKCRINELTRKLYTKSGTEDINFENPGQLTRLEKLLNNDSLLI